MTSPVGDVRHVAMEWRRIMPGRKLQLVGRLPKYENAAPKLRYEIMPINYKFLKFYCAHSVAFHSPDSLREGVF